MDWPFDYPASVVEADTSIIYCLDLNLAITYCNPAWDRFAIAWPFTRVEVTFGGPVDPETAADPRAEVERSLALLNAGQAA